jgi:benzoylformate decarboxylase
MATVRDVTRELFRHWGTTTIFGNPGSTELPFLSDWPDDFRYVLGLQEGAVVAMADGYAQYTGNAAVINLHSAGGLGHALGSLVTAYHNRSPLIVIAGQQSRPLLNGVPFLGAIDAANFPRPYVKWAAEPASAAEVPAAIARAYHTAMQPPYGPTYLSVPADDWNAPATAISLRPRVRADHPLTAEAVAEIAAALDNSERPALVVGAAVDADGAVESVIELAERSRAAVFASPMSGRCSFPEDHPLFAGFLIPSRKKVAEALAAHDLVVVLGAPAFTYHVHTADPGPALPTVYLVGDDETTLAWAPDGIGFRATPRLAIQQLTAAIGRVERESPSPLVRREQPAASEPMSGAFVMHTISTVLPTDAVVVEEAPGSRKDLHEFLPIRSRDGGFLTMSSGVLGYGLPAAIGVALAQPGRPVVAIIGDGSSMYTISALWTAAQEQIPVVFVILDNGQYAALRAHAAGDGVSKSPGWELGGLDFVALANGMGCAAQRVERPDELEPALVDALAADVPTVLHVKIDPYFEYPY